MISGQLGTTFDSATYNALISVEDADARARGDNGPLAGFLEQASPIFLAHGMHERFGVGLLHKHFRCDGDERLIEYAERFCDQDALVTRPARRSDPEAVPSIWKVSDGEYAALSFSTETLARELYAAGEVPAAFLRDFGKLTQRLNVESLFGLAVVDRKLFYQGQPNETPVEISDQNDRISVMTMKDQGGFRFKTIQTAWAFGASTDCATTCKMECWNVHPDGHHTEHHEHHIVRPD